jgi:Cu2+-containing amine oxidase
MSSSGHIRWPPEAPVWTFFWEVIDGHSEAIAFLEVRFRGIKVFHKASLPMIRVQYDSGDGPYKDALGGGNMKGPVTVSEGSHPAYRFLVVESYHRIGRYHLLNRWIFRSDGIVLPQLYSAGLQHPSNHRHHCYWRFDLDIDGAATNLALQHALTGTDWGYGPGWIPKRNEISTIHIGDNVWAVLNKTSNRGCMIYQGPFDGASDWFSRTDVAVTAYHGPEDVKGGLGTAHDDELWKHVNGENVDGQDIVLWYVAHLQHVAHDNGDEWHVCGPILQLFGY